MKILYATDGMSPSLEAASLLEAIARREGTEVTVLSVAYAGIPALEHAVFQMDPLPDRRTAAVQIVDAAVEKLRAAGFDAVAKIAEGHPAQEILTVIEDEWFDLTVVGGSVRSWAGRHLLGSVSTHVLHSSPSSVLVVHEASLGQRRPEVLLATDGSRGSDKAIQWLGRFADPDRCRITTFAVGHHPEVFFHPVPGYVPPAELASARMELEAGAMQAAETLARQAQERLTLMGFSVTERATVGDPVGSILKEAESGGFDLVAVGARGRGGIQRGLLGSVSDQVVRHVPAAFVARRFVD